MVWPMQTLPPSQSMMAQWLQPTWESITVLLARYSAQNTKLFPHMRNLWWSGTTTLKNTVNFNPNYWQTDHTEINIFLQKHKYGMKYISKANKINRLSTLVPLSSMFRFNYVVQFFRIKSGRWNYLDLLPIECERLFPSKNWWKTSWNHPCHTSELLVIK